MGSNSTEAQRKPYEPRPRLWTREEYHRAAKLGIFRPDERLELILGQIFEKPRQSSAHTAAIRSTTVTLEMIFGPLHEIRYRMPLALSDQSEPEPDVLVLREPLEAYEDRQPEAVDVLLVVEVVDGTQRMDWHIKSGLFATASIQEYWTLDLKKRKLAIHRSPNNNSVYQSYDL